MLIIRVHLQIVVFLPEVADVQIQRTKLAAGQDVLLQIKVIGPRLDWV
jgi:hypothetical protein